MAFSGQWKVPGCCPYKQPDIPQNNANLMRLTLTGTFFRDTPTYFNPKGEMINLQFYADVPNLYYSWLFYKPENQELCKLNMILVTTEDVMPNLFEEITQTRMKLHRAERWNGRTTWIITC